MNRSIVRAAIFAGVLNLIYLVGISSAQAQATIYNQPTNSLSGFASQNDATNGNGNFATAYDNFTLGSNDNIGAVTWNGVFYNGSPTAISSFTIAFYADNAGMPGSLLHSEALAGNAAQTSMGLDASSNPLFSYSATLSAPFSAIGGTQYWMSIVPTVAFPPQWGWESGTSGDGAARQLFLGAPGPLASDLAFSLINSPSATAVPEPGSVALAIGLGQISLLIMRRRRRRQA